ncbi:MAG: outer membrane beta-barrel protein, partial [Bacteroidota bacterium]
MAQQITGTLMDKEAGTPLEFATITLLSPQDSGLIKGVVTDLDGSFSIDTEAGNYLVKAEFIGYQPQFFNNLDVQAGQTVELGSINLAAEAQVMDAVEVRAEKSTMQMALDKKIFNVGKDLASTSGSAAEVLDNIPSVQVDVEGQVSLRGSGGVQILVDGKPSSLIGVRGTDGLRSLPANLIERVEVITNPSSKYEAEGMSGIINIILRKERKSGFNGSFDLTGGIPEQAGMAFNLNYRREKLNFFTNYSYNRRQTPSISNRYQEFYREDGTTSIVDQKGDRVRGGQSHNFRFGADYFANDRNTITTSFAFRRSDNNNTSDIIYSNYEDSFPDNLSGISTRSEVSEEIEPNLEFSINHKKTFERKGHEWSNSIQYRSSLEDQFSQFEELFFDADFNELDRDDLLQRASNKEGERSFLIRSDYTYPFAEEGKFEVGYFGSLRRIDNDYLVEQFGDGVWNRLANLSNDFNYDENIQALYANIGNKKGKISYQIGLRAEYSSVLTELLQTSEINDRNYLNLFPSAFFTYDFS